MELRVGFDRVVKNIISARGTYDAASVHTMFACAREKANKLSLPFNPRRFLRSPINCQCTTDFPVLNQNNDTQ
jgi:hypothetical protein